jgi:FKBP-type peptidyl-prolyl cis-trans isomerase FkpA
MTEITRVPLQPIASGSLSKLWLGALVAGALGVGVAMFARPPLVDVETVTPGAGAHPGATDYVLMNYVGRTDDGHVFDQQKRAVMPLSGVIPGFTKALQQMQAGGKYEVTIPAALGYGDHAVGSIPANSRLHFTIELVDFKSAAEIEAQQRMMEQMRAMQAQQQGGAGAGAPAGPAAGLPGQ